MISEYPTGENGDSIFVFIKTLDLKPVEVGDRLQINSIEDSFVQYAAQVTVDSSTTTFNVVYDTVGMDDIGESINIRVGLISLDNVESERTDPFPFSEIMPPALVSAIESAIDLAGDSASVVVDTVSLVPQQDTVAFNSFNSVAVSSGFLDITIINELFIPLGAPIIVDVKTISGNSLFMLTWDAEIPVGDSSTKSQDLDNITLPGELLVEVSGISNGSGGDTVSVKTSDLNTSFRIRLEARDLQVVQADAIVPEQTITDTGIIELAPSETLVEEAVLLSGDLNIALTNNLPLTGIARITIPDLFYQTRDAVFQQDIDLLTGMPTVTVSDLTGWSMTMDLAEQQLDYNTIIFTDDTDPEYVILEQSDSVQLDLTITNISFSQITGQIESQTTIDSGTIDIKSDSKIQTALISEGYMTLDINNRIGGVADLQLAIPGLLRAGTFLDTVLLVEPGYNSHPINLSGYNVVPVSLADQRLTYNTVTVTRIGNYTYDLLDSIEVVANMSELTFESLVGYISQDDNVEEGVIELGQETKVESALINTGEMRLTIQNFIGLEADIIFELADLTRGGSSLIDSFHLSSSQEPVVARIDLAGYTLSLPLDDQRIHYTSTMRIPSDELLSLTLEDSIAIDVLIDTLLFTSVTGIIDTVEVVLDTVEQTISALPDEMSGFNYTRVEIYIDFDSEITIPVFLDLTLDASNIAGDRARSSVSNWNILDSSRVIIPKGAELFNIRPNRLLAYGIARAGGTDAYGTVTSDQTISGIMTIRAPLEFEISPDALISTEPELLKQADSGATVPGEIEEVVVFIRYENQFEFGSVLSVFMSQDTLSFDDGTADILVDSLMLAPDQSGQDSLLLNDERLDLFNQDSMYIQARIHLLGRVDENGRPLPTRFLSTDSLRINLYGRLQYLMDGAALGRKVK
ncbi:MAG: hypothetical protein IIA60_04205 [Candidatus Marinimicrobia bacterium]|nr:hypothetical protein [Candidatus Neomarinimicrobiota bacterium]